jgi:hypothetical protein
MMAELQDAIERAMKGIRDPDAMQKACERMDNRPGMDAGARLSAMTPGIVPHSFLIF